MTNEEAISYLENAVCELDTGIKVYRGTVKEEFIEQRECFTVALAALREQAERDKGCEYCKDELDLESGNCLEPSLFIRGNELIARRYDERDSVAEINLCPMCGKRLGKRRESEVT